MMTYRTKQGDMLDDICWKFYGASSGMVEQVLESNRAHDLGRFRVFPAGVEISLPDVPATPPEKPMTRLWE